MSEIIFIRGLTKAQKANLKVEADKLGLPLSVYARMLLIKSLQPANK